MARDIEKQRAAKRRYYERHRELYRDKNRRKRERVRALVREYKSRPCADCKGLFPFYVMDFDGKQNGSSRYDGQQRESRTSPR